MKQFYVLTIISGAVTRLRAGLQGFNPWQVHGGILSLRHRVQTGSGTRPASYPMDTGGDFAGSRAVGM